MLSADGLRAAGEEALSVPTGIHDEEIQLDASGDGLEEGVVGERGCESHP